VDPRGAGHPRSRDRSSIVSGSRCQRDGFRDGQFVQTRRRLRSGYFHRCPKLRRARQPSAFIAVRGRATAQCARGRRFMGRWRREAITAEWLGQSEPRSDRASFRTGQDYSRGLGQWLAFDTFSCSASHWSAVSCGSANASSPKPRCRRTQ
jgi:hypothetical protein